MLIKLGLATYEDKLTIDADRVAQFITDRSRAGQITLPPIDDVFAAWISLFACQRDHASAKRLPFVPHDDIRPVMDALAALGYAKPLGNAFIWTDRIGRAMRMSGLWDENNLSREELEERDVDLEMRAALASIPEDVAHACAFCAMARRRGVRSGVRNVARSENMKTAKRSSNPIDKHVGSRVRMRRKMLGLSQTTLGDELGLTFQQVQKYENGTNRISASRLLQSAHILQVPVEFFFEGAPRVAGRPKGLSEAPSPAYVSDFLASTDGLALTKAFTQIKDAKARRHIVDLVKQIAGDDGG